MSLAQAYPPPPRGVSEQTMLFSPIELKLFFCFSHLLKNEITNNLYVCHSMIVGFCHCDPFVCVTLAVSSFIYLNMFRSAPNLIQIFLGMIFLLQFSIFTVFIDLFYFFGTSPIFWGAIQTTPKSNFYGFVGWMDCSKTILLRGVLCKNVCFLRYCTY